MKDKSNQNLVYKVIGIIGSLVVLTFSGSFLDAFNMPKFLVLVVGTIFLVSFYLTFNNVNTIRWEPNKFPLLLLLSFMTTNIISIFINGFTYDSVFGAYGRQMGIISLVCLITIASIILISQDSNYEQFLNFLLWSLSISNLYGLFQFLNTDFLQYEELYDGINSTFGNPNFAGAGAAIALLLSIKKLLEKNSVSKKVVYLILSLLAFINMYASNARQSFISAFIGITILGIFWARKQSKTIIICYSGFSIGALAFIVLALFQIGPLTTYLYKTSISERGDFYRAALRMIRENPLFGVGIDQFGLVYRRFRDLDQVQRTGINATSDSAHNSLLQTTATSGVVSGLLLAVIYFSVVYLFIKKRNFELKDFSLLSVWVALSSQNLISVDHPSLTIWWWILSALLLKKHSARMKLEAKSVVNIKERQILAIGVGFVSVLVSTIFVLPIMKSQQLLFKGFTLGINKQDVNSINYKRSIFEKSFSDSFGNYQIFRLAANSFFQDGEYKSAIIMSKKALKIQPLDYPSSWFQAESYKLTNNPLAAQAWLRTTKLDPLNFRNRYEFANAIKDSDPELALLELKKAKALYPDSQTKIQINELIAQLS
jgi:O-antigen ligase